MPDRAEVVNPVDIFTAFATVGNDDDFDTSLRLNVYSSRQMAGAPFTPFTRIRKSKPMDTEKIKEVLKERHLNGDERRFYHKPDSDWKASDSGEKFISACTLEVKDLLEKHSIKPIVPKLRDTTRPKRLSLGF